MLMTDGDAIKVLFPAAASADPTINALATAEKISIALSQIASQLKSLDESLPKDWQIQFRAGLAVGKIRPVWQEIGRDRFPNWVECDDSQPFLLSARLMELERKIEAQDDSGSSIVMVPFEIANAAEQSGKLLRPFDSRDLMMAGKHGKQYRVSVYCVANVPTGVNAA